uniref:General transcription factor IIH subunit 1-like n=1 Tax=Hirondellea gigas TaxID=1518452 RepID=A0A2P2I1J3_9CRUS
MGDKSEDILLQINHVRYKKSDGQLCVAHKKIGWIIDNTDNFALSVLYTEIKTQKISPEGKPKVQLQLILNDQNTHVFHFTNPAGKDKQTQDRNNVKERLSQLLTASKRQPPDELLEKKRILEENPQLYRLYQELVPKNLLDPDDFWKEIAATYKKTLPPTMQMGISGAFLADIKPQTDSTNGKVQYNLTPEIMLAVYRTYPAVKKKHDDYVPSRMTESDFWTRFFQSHYYSAHTTSRTEDVFFECAKYDDKEWVRDLAKIVNDPMLFLSNIYEEPPFSVAKQTVSKAGSNHMHATMIRRFNQHSQNILKAQSRSEQDRLYEEMIAKNPDNLTNGTPAPQLPEPKSKRARLLEKLVYSDLESSTSTNTSALNLQQKDRYLAGPPTHNTVEPTPPHQLEALKQELALSLSTWKPSFDDVQNPVQAHKTLQMMSGKCREGRQSEPDTNGLVEELPLELRGELSAVYSSGGELLRHFWSCFPPRTPQLISKLHTLHATLAKYHQNTLRPFQDKAVRDYSYRSGVLDHLVHMFHTANTKYENWKARYGGR